MVYIVQIVPDWHSQSPCANVQATQSFFCSCLTLQPAPVQPVSPSQESAIVIKACCPECAAKLDKRFRCKRPVPDITQYSLSRRSPRILPFDRSVEDINTGEVKMLEQVWRVRWDKEEAAIDLTADDCC
jgi:hypothetical protein